MSWIAAAILATGVGSAVISSNAATDAANTQANAAAQASATQLQMFNQMRGDLQPYMQQGTTSLADLQKLMANPSMVTQLPGYQFQMGQGIDAINNSAAAKGFTGNTMRDLTTFGQGMASNYYSDYWKKLMEQINMGQNSAAGVGNAGINTGQSIGNNMIGAGNALAAGQVGSANAMATGIGGASGSLSTILQSLMNGGGSNTGTWTQAGFTNPIGDAMAFANP